MASSKIKGINIKIGADTRGLDTALQGIEKAGKGAKTELREVERALKSAPESAELWRQKQELLTTAVEESRKKVEFLEDAQKQIQKQFENKEIDDGAYRAFQRELENARAEAKRFGGQLEETENKVKELKGTADKTAESAHDLSDGLHDAGDQAESSSDGFTVMKGALADLAADGIRSAIDSFKELAAESETALNTLQTKTGATAEQMEDYRGVMDKLYSNNYGEDKNDIAQSIAEVKQQLGDISPDELEKVTENALLLRDTFEFDVNESIRAAKMLMSQFEISADEAYTLIAQGAQNGLNKNGDLLDTINEYAVHYNQLGYSAEEFFNSLSNGTAAGTFSVDKLGDAMKEFGIRTKDTADSTTEGFDLIGLDADEMRQKFAEGGEAAKQAAQETIDALFALDDKIVQNQAGVDLFGTMWEDLGSEGIAALSNISGTADKTAGVLQDIADIKYNDAANQAELLKRKLKTEFLEPVANKVMPLLIDKMDWVVEHLPEILETISGFKPLILGVGTAVAALKITNKIEKAGEAFKKFNGIMLKNPYAAVAAGIIGITTAVGTWIAKNNDVIIVTDEVCDKLREEYKAISDTRTKIDDLNSSFEENAGAVDTEFGRIQALRDELNDLADASGNVQAKDKLRAEYILGELNDALGTEYQMAGDQIENYQQLQTEIDKVIEKKRAEAMLDAYNAQAAEMAQAKADAHAQYATAETKYQTAKSLEYAAQGRFDRLNTKGYTIEQVLDEKIDGDSELFEAAEELRKAQSRTKLAETNANTAYSSYQDAVDYEQRGRDAMRLISEEKYAEAEDVLYTAKDTNRQILKDGEKTDFERNAAYKESLRERTNELKAAIDVGSSYEIDAAFRAVKATVEAGQQAGEQVVVTSQLISSEMREQIQRAVDGGYDISSLAEWMADTGLELTDVFGENYTEVVQKQFDEGYDISDLARWMKNTGIEMSDVFGENYTEVVQKQFDAGYDVTDLLAWATDTDGRLLGKFDEEFLMKVQDKLDAGFDNANLVMWAEKEGMLMGEIMGMSLSERVSKYTNWLYRNNPILSQTTTRWGNSDRVEMSRNGQGGIYVRPEDVDRYMSMGYTPRYATGGYIPYGGSGIVAEAGPELLQVMNGGIKITPLTEKARNTEVSTAGGSQRIFYNTYNINNPKISNGMDVRRLAENLASEQRRIETGRGE